MNSVELIRKICKERKIPISKLERDLGYGNGYIGQLKKGTIPSNRAIEIAQYLSIDLSYLLSGEEHEKKETTLTPRDERDIKKDLDSIMEKIEAGEDSPLYYNGEEVDKESMELLRDAIGMSLRHLKIINKKKYNPHKNKK